MDNDHRIPLIRSTGEFGYLTRSRLSEGPKRLDSPTLRLNKELVRTKKEKLVRPQSPAAYTRTNNQLTPEQTIKEISANIEQIFPKVVNSPYSFTDVKILSTETHALAVTNEGFCIYVDISHNTFEEQLLSQHALSSVVVCKNDSQAFIKEKDYGKIYYIELPSMKVKKTLKISGEVTNGIGKMCLSPDENFLYARLWKGEIVRWDLQNLKDYQIMLSEKNVTCMNLSPDGIFVLGTADKKLILYSLKFEKIAEKNVEFIVDAYICFSQTGNFILLGMAKTIKLYEKDTLTLVKEFEVGCQTNDCRMTEDQKYVVAVLESGHLGFFSMDIEGKELRIKIHDSGIQTLHVTRDQKKIYTFGLDNKLSHVNFPNLTMFKTMQELNLTQSYLVTEGIVGGDRDVFNAENEDDEPFKALCVVYSPNGDYLIAGGESNKLFFFEADTLKKFDELSGHQDYIYSLAIINDHYIASGSADHTIIIWDLLKKKKRSSLFRHFGTVSALCKLDQKRLASGSHDHSIKIWAWESEILLYSIPDLPDSVISLSLCKSNYLLCGFKRVIHCWSLQTYSLVFEKSLEKDLKCLKLIESSQSQGPKLYYSLDYDDNSICIENPFLSEEITYWGPDESRTYDFIAYIREIFSGKIPAYDAYMEFWLISPYNINVLHLYAYFNFHHYLAQSIVNGAALINSSSGFNPLTIALKMKNKECVEVIIKNAWKRYQFNPYIFSGISPETIQELNTVDTYLLPKVYKLLLFRPEPNGKFFARQSQLPVVQLNFASILHPDSLLQANNKNNEVEAKFLQSSVALYLNSGSQKSIEFLKSLIECKHQEVFATEIIQYLLIYKWNHVKYFLYTELVIFITFFGYLLYGVLFPVTIRESWIIASLGLVLFLFNFYTSIISRSFSLGHLIDFFRFISLTLYFVMIQLSYSEDLCQIVMMITTIFSFLQGLTYFKLFSSTRHVIRVGLDLIKQSLSLVFLMFYILLVICILIYINQNYEKSPALILMTSNPNFSGLTEFFQLFFDYIIPGIVIVGLLAICGNNYERNLISRAAEYRELAEIVLKGEYCLVCKRNKNWLQYLHVCTYELFVGVDRVKKVAKAVKLVKQGQESHRYEILEGFAEIKEKLEGLNAGIRELKKEKRHRKK